MRAAHAVRRGHARAGWRSATNAFPPLLRRLSSYVVPVWDYALMTEPLTGAQRAAVGWADRHGVADAGNLFHYYRVTDDWRILWGGYDAVYHFGGRTDDRLDRNPETFLRLAEHFFATFPAARGAAVHPRLGRHHRHLLAVLRVLGHGARAAGSPTPRATPGSASGASRFGAQVLLDLLAGEQTERTALEMVRSKPLPFPPEPVRWAGIELTRRAVAKADARERPPRAVAAHPGPVGLGFDS